MSGGSYNYAYMHVDDFLAAMRCHTPERKAFGPVLGAVAAAMRAIEWVDSSDYSEGDENKAIRDVFLACGGSLPVGPDDPEELMP